MPKNVFDSLTDVKFAEPDLITGFMVLIVYIIYVITFNIYLFVTDNTRYWFTIGRLFTFYWQTLLFKLLEMKLKLLNTNCSIFCHFVGLVM